MRNDRASVLHFLNVSRMRAEVYGYAPDMVAAKRHLMALAKKFPATFNALEVFIELSDSGRDSECAILRRTAEALI